MARGQEHAGKVGGAKDANLYDLLQGKIDYDFFIITSGAPNPVRHSNSTIFAGSENSTANIAIVAHERFESNKSKDNNTEWESTTGSP